MNLYLFIGLIVGLLLIVTSLIERFAPAWLKRELGLFIRSLKRK